MSESTQLILSDKPLERAPFPDGIVLLDIVQYLWLDDEEPTIDPPFARLIFFSEGAYHVTIELEATESFRRSDRRHGRQSSKRTMEADQSSDVDIAQSITIGDTERLITNPFA